jgi:hypothetical protein
MAWNKTGELRLVIKGRGRSELPTGVRAAPPFLPEPLYRLPGETIEQLAHRTLQTVVGHGLAVVWFFYPDEVKH